MTRAMLALLAIAALPAMATAQTDTTRRDTTRTPQASDSTRRVRAEARGEIDLSNPAARFRAELPNYGLTPEQAGELQQALARLGCDVGTADGIVGPRTLRAIECFRAQQSSTTTDLESVLTLLNVSFARPPAPQPVDSVPAPKRDSVVLPPVLRPDTMYRADVRARRDSALKRDSLMRRDSTRRDSTRRDSTRRDSTARPDTTRRP